MDIIVSQPCLEILIQIVHWGPIVVGKHTEIQLLPLMVYNLRQDIDQEGNHGHNKVKWLVPGQLVAQGQSEK